MGEEIVISDINGICRLCLKGNGTIIPIFGRENTSRDCIPLSKKILDCVSIKVFDGDGLSNMICVGCVHQVDSWHGFKNTCDSSQEKLLSWLQKTRPDIFSKNHAGNRQKNSINLIEVDAHYSTVIDLSSDEDDDDVDDGEDDVVITNSPTVRHTLSDSGQRVRNRLSGSSHNIELLSLNTDEIEIFPIDDDDGGGGGGSSVGGGGVGGDDSLSEEKENSQSEHENIPSSNTVLDGTTESDTADNGFTDSADDHILPDANVPGAILNSTPSTSNSSDETTTKDIPPKDYAISNELNPIQTSQCQESIEDNINKVSNEQMEIAESEFTEVSEIINSESQDKDTLVESIVDPLTNNQDSVADQENSNWSISDDVVENVGVQEIEPLNKTSSDNAIEIRNSLPSNENSDNGNRVADDMILSTVDKPTEEPTENSVDNSSSLVIEKVTSLTDHDTEKIDENTDSREQDHESANSVTAESCRSWNRLNQDEDTQDVQPDIVLCDTPMVMNIKEEPLSAGEGTGDEDDPLNFQTITIKREPEDWTIRTNYISETEDVKPNIRLLNETMDSNYTPKKLKSGKIHCEPCRISFLNDVYYDRHATSLRHKMNIKLYRSGRAPTKKRGRSLIEAIMGNTYDFPKGKGPFYCNQCPSGFKHLKNLKTHQKKHLAQAAYLEQEQSAGVLSKEVSDLEICNQASSKPPPRQSAQNLNFSNIDSTKCDLCNQYFTTVPALVSHKRFCGSSGNRICKWCHETFTTMSLFFRHRKECVKLYRKQILNMTQQEQKKYTPVPIQSPVPLDGTVLACTLCNLTFQSSPDLISHMQQNHMDYGKPQSPIELPNFTKPNNFSRYRDSKLHYCKYCIRAFSTHSALSSHTGYHARKNVYCCKFCKHIHRDKISFRQHMKVHIGNPNLKNVCWICYTPFGSPKDLIDHKNIHANIKMKIFSCGVCGNSYNTRELLSRHKKSAHNTVQPSTMFSEEIEELSENESKVQYIDEDNKLYKCKLCKKKFTTQGNLKRHMLKHKRLPNVGNLGVVNIEHSYQNRCSSCFRTFKTLSGLLNHRPVCSRVKKAATISNINNVLIGSSHGGKPHKCRECKKWFASQNSLYKHRVLKRCKVQQVNEEIVVHLRAQNCPNCDQQFLSEESLNRHKQHCKPTIEKLTCDCGEVFSSIEQKLDHTDSCPANCTCKTCNLKFNSPEELDSHLLVCQIEPQSPSPPAPQAMNTSTSYSHENRLPPAECSKCNKKFVYSKCLKIHQDKCFYDRWPCTNCMEIFSTEAALATHKSHKTCQSPRLNRSPSITSLNESPTFKCEYCPKRFNSGNELKQHSLACENRPHVRRRDVSSVYRPWSCDLCEKSFLWKANLWRHKKLIHNVFPNKGDPSESRRLSMKSESPVRTNLEKEANSFRCRLCPDIVFHKEQGYLEHQLLHERQEGTSLDTADEGTGGNVLLTCELCDKKLPEALYPLHMDEHMNDDFEESNELQIEDTLTPKFACDICGKEFDSPVSRKSHRATHYRNGDVLSHLSPKKSPLKKRKLKVKHIRCTTCNKLLSINSMPKHKMMHVREAAEFYGDNQSTSPSKPSPVVITPRSATPSMISDLCITQQVSEGDTVFPCPKCDKSFKLRKLLFEHFKGHQDESFETESTSSNTGTADQYPYKCLYCDLSWKHKSVYERHLSSKKHIEIQKQLSGII